MLWGAFEDIASFDDPGPALAYAVLNGDGAAQQLLASVVRHHSSGIEFPTRVPKIIARGLPVLHQLIEKSGLDADTKVGKHSVKSLLEATYALGVACESL